jgi:DNA polymerase-3 subunit epsilon
MDNLQKYSWWGEENAPPAHLKTTKQLAEMGFKPVRAVGIIPTRKYDLYLYDPSDSTSAIPKKQATPRQLEALAKARRQQKYSAWYAEWGRHYEAGNEAIEWARELFQRDNWIILDTETTGLGQAEVVQVGVVDHTGAILLDTLVRPTITIPQEAVDIHGITNEMVVDAPTFPEIYPELVRVSTDKEVLIYNAEFDISILKYCCKLHGLPLLGYSKRSDCVMEWWAQFCGEYDYDRYGGYKLQPLEGDHSAVGDCQAVFTLLQGMAAADIIDLQLAFAGTLQ